MMNAVTLNITVKLALPLKSWAFCGKTFTAIDGILF